MGLTNSSGGHPAFRPKRPAREEAAHAAGPDTTVYGAVFTEIERRLEDRYRINIKDHLGEMIVPDVTGKFDPSLGGTVKGLGGAYERTLPGKRAKKNLP